MGWTTAGDKAVVDYSGVKLLIIDRGRQGYARRRSFAQPSTRNHVDLSDSPLSRTSQPLEEHLVDAPQTIERSDGLIDNLGVPLVES